MSVAHALNALPHTPSSGSASPPIPPPTPLSPTGSGFPDDSRPATAIASAPTAPTPTTTTTTTNTNHHSAGTAAAADAPVKRKASRRANTAERRATHNAVERQRRETLNSRFLDLAALLPNLATVRRPSKSAIVNSSIALIHSQRRARAGAGRELRVLEAETTALRREVNEWRARAALPALQSPVRTAEYAALVSAEELGAHAEEEERRAYALVGQEAAEEEEYEEVEEQQQQQRGAQWNAQLQYALQQQQQQAQQVQQAQEWAAQAALFTPPGSGHGAPFDGVQGDVFASFARQPAYVPAPAPAPPPFAYAVPVPAPVEEHGGSGTESTHGSPGSSGHGHAGNANAYGGYAPQQQQQQQQQHHHHHWGGAAPYAPMGVLI